MQDQPDRHPPFLPPRLGARPFVGGQPSAASPRIDSGREIRFSAPRPFSSQSRSTPDVVQTEAEPASVPVLPEQAPAPPPPIARNTPRALAAVVSDGDVDLWAVDVPPANESANTDAEQDAAPQDWWHQSAASPQPSASASEDDDWWATPAEPPPAASVTPESVAPQSVAPESVAPESDWWTPVEPPEDATAQTEPEWWGMAPETPPPTTAWPDESPFVEPPSPALASQPELWTPTPEPAAPMPEGDPFESIPMTPEPASFDYATAMPGLESFDGSAYDAAAPQGDLPSASTAQTSDALARRLEAMAQRIRAGEIVVADGTSERSDAAVLAALLSALLGGRD